MHSVRDAARPPEAAARSSGDLRGMRPVAILAGLVLVGALLYWARGVLLPVAVAALLSFVLAPVVTALERRGVRRAIAVLLVVAMACAAVAAVGWVLATQVRSLAEELPRYRDNIRQKVAALREAGRGGWVDRLRGLADDVLGELERSGPMAPREAPTPVVVVPDRRAMLRQLVGLVEPVVTACLVLALVAFVLLRQVELRARAIRLVGRGRLPVATKALDEAAERISHYLLMQSLVNASFGAAVGLGLSVIGLPYAVLWGVLAGILRFVPYVGAWMAALMPLLLALALFDGWQQPLLVLALFLVLEPTIFLAIEPLLYGTSTGVSDVALVVAVIFWTWLWGPVGLILATPLTVCLAVVGKYVPDLAFLGVLLGEARPLPPHVEYYQRLLAEDEDEAAAIVDAYVDAHGVEPVYDAVLLPALAEVKQDRGRGPVTADDARFVVGCTRDIVEELGLRAPAAAVPGAGERIVVLGCPARDEIDELALVMFAHLLEGVGAEVRRASATSLSSEVVELARETRPALVCVAAVAPGGLAHARYLVKRLRGALAEPRVLVGRWAGDASRDEVRRDEVRRALVRAGADDVGFSLAESRDQVRRLLPLLATAEPAGPAAATRRSA